MCKYVYIYIERKKKGKKLLVPSKLKIIIPILGVIVLFLVIISLIPIDSVTITGNKQFTVEQIREDLFSGKQTENLGKMLWKQFPWAKDEIAYLKEYSISFENYHSILVHVEEKEILGCLDYGGTYVYIDVDGMVLGLDEEKREGIPVLEGVYVTQALLYETIHTEQIEKLEKLEYLGNLLKQKDIIVDILCCTSQETFRVDIGSVQVFLGDYIDLEEKVNTLFAILPKMEGLSGKLYLNEYDGKNPNAGYRFEVSQ